MAQDKRMAEARRRPAAPRRDRAAKGFRRARLPCCNRREPSSARRIKGRIKGVATSGATLNFGQFGLKAMEPDRLTARQIEAARRAMTRHMKRAGRVWIRVFPDVPVSKKPLEVRMGSGKGAPEYWVVRVKPGRILFEIDGVTDDARRGGARSRRGQAADQDALRRAHRGIGGGR